MAGWQGAGAGSVGRTGQAGGVDTGADGSRAGAGTFCATASGRSCSYLSLGVPTRSLACTTGRNPLVAALIAGRAASAASRNLRRWNPCALFANVECILGHWVLTLGQYRRLSVGSQARPQVANRERTGHNWECLRSLIGNPILALRSVGREPQAESFSTSRRVTKVPRKSPGGKAAHVVCV